MLTAITGHRDPRLADYVSLRDVALRKHLESEQGLFIAEGAKVIRRALEAGYRPRSFLLAERWLPGLDDLIEQWPTVPVYVVSEALAEQVTGFHVHRGALASLHRETRHQVADLLAMRRLVILEDIVDHTNVGAVFRSAAALGMDGVILSPRCADPLYRRSVKVSMGAVFSIPWSRVGEWFDAMAEVSAAGFTTVALTPGADSVPLDEYATGHDLDKICLVLGSEGPGLSSRWLSTAAVRARIDMARDVDSLNVAAAAAIAFFQIRTRAPRARPVESCPPPGRHP